MQENNKLIAEFMGWKYHKGFFLNPDNGAQTFPAESFTYDTSWDSLMLYYPYSYWDPYLYDPFYISPFWIDPILIW